MYSDISGYKAEWITSIPVIGTIIEYIGLSIFAAAFGTGMLIGGIGVTIYYAWAYNKANKMRTNYARVNYGDEINDISIAKDCINQHIQFEIYDHVAVSSNVMNFFKTGLYVLASHYKVSKIFGKELKPSQAIFKDINVTDDAYNFVYASGRFDGLNETQLLTLYDYYIERHTFWEKNYYE